MNRVDERFEKGLAGLQSVSLSEKEKGAIFSKLERHVLAHPAISDRTLYAFLSRIAKNAFSVMPWRQR